MGEIYFDKPTDYLNFEFRLRKHRRPAYSLRAFARDLDMSPSNLCDFLKGRYGISQDRATSIGRILKWSPERREHFCDLITATYSAQSPAKKKAKFRIQTRVKDAKAKTSLDQFRVVSDWQHMALLVFVQMESAPVMTEDLAQRLSLTPTETRKHLERLERVGLVQSQMGRWKTADTAYRVGDESPSEAIRTFHQQVLQLAAQSIDQVPMPERANLSLMFSIQKEKFPLLEQELREVILKTLSHYVQPEPHDSVQALTFHMFPVWSKESS